MLSSVDQLSKTDFLVGRLERYGVPVVGKGGVARVGSFLSGGVGAPLVRGSAVTLEPDKGGCVTAKCANGQLRLPAEGTQFVVLSLTGDKVRLLYDHRKT